MIPCLQYLHEDRDKGVRKVFQFVCLPFENYAYDIETGLRVRRRNAIGVEELAFRKTQLIPYAP